MSCTIFIFLMSDKVMVSSIEAIVPACCHALDGVHFSSIHVFVALVFSKTPFSLSYCFAWDFFFVVFFFPHLVVKIWNPTLKQSYARVSETQTIILWHHQWPVVISCGTSWCFLPCPILALFPMFCCVVSILFILPVFYSSFCCSIWPTGPSSFHLYLLLPNPIIPY